MKRHIIFGALVLGMLSLSGCSTAINTVPGSSPSVNTTTTSATPSNTVGALTEADMRIGKLYLGESKASLLQDFGTASGKTTVHGNGSPQWIYQTQGFYINGFPVWEIDASSSFKGSTPRGIHIGSTVAAVKKAYPTLQWNAKLQQFYGATKNNGYNIDFMIYNGMVQGIVMSKATP